MHTYSFGRGREGGGFTDWVFPCVWPQRAAQDAGPGPSSTDPQNEGEAGAKKKQKKGGPAALPPPAQWFDLKNNTSVYVTGLPEDTSVDEVAAAFGKCGVIKLDEAQQPRIKLYRYGMHRVDGWGGAVHSGGGRPCGPACQFSSSSKSRE